MLASIVLVPQAGNLIATNPRQNLVVFCEVHLGTVADRSATIVPLEIALSAIKEGVVVQGLSRFREARGFAKLDVLATIVNVAFRITQPQPSCNRLSGTVVAGNRPSASSLSLRRKRSQCRKIPFGNGRQHQTVIILRYLYGSLALLLFPLLHAMLDPIKLGLFFELLDLLVSLFILFEAGCDLFLLLLFDIGHIDNDLARVVVVFIHQHKMLCEKSPRVEQFSQIGFSEEDRDGCFHGRVFHNQRELQLFLPGPLEPEVVDEDKLSPRVLQYGRSNDLLPNLQLNTEVLALNQFFVEGFQSNDNGVYEYAAIVRHYIHFSFRGRQLANMLLFVFLLLLLDFLLGLENHLNLELHVPDFPLWRNIQGYLFLRCQIPAVDEVEHTEQCCSIQRQFLFIALANSRVSFRFRCSHFLHLSRCVDGWHWRPQVSRQPRFAYQLESNVLLVLEVELDGIVVIVVAIAIRHRKLLLLDLVPEGRLQKQHRLIFEVPDERHFYLREAQQIIVLYRLLHHILDLGAQQFVLQEHLADGYARLIDDIQLLRDGALSVMLFDGDGSCRSSEPDTLRYVILAEMDLLAFPQIDELQLQLGRGCIRQGEYKGLLPGQQLDVVDGLRPPLLFGEPQQTINTEQRLGTVSYLSSPKRDNEFFGHYIISAPHLQPTTNRNTFAIGCY